VQDDIAASSVIVQQHILSANNCAQSDISGTGFLGSSIVITPANRIIAERRARRIMRINKGGVYGN
jgi:predicted amidohydrolase